MMIRRLVMGAALVCLLVSVSAPSASASPTVQADARRFGAVPSGYTGITITKAGFSIAVPSSWAALDYSARGITARYARLAPSLSAAQVSILNPDRVPSQTVLRAASPDGVPDLAVDFASGDFSSPSANGGRAALATAFTHIAVRRTRVAGRAALVATGVETGAPVSGPTARYAASFAVVGPRGGLVLSFLTSDPGPQDSTVRTMIASVRFLR